MKPNLTLKFVFFSALAGFTLLLTNCSPPAEKEKTEEAPGEMMNVNASAERGEYLVTISGCDDCHSPKMMTPMGPEIDSTRRLSGHPADGVLGKIDPASIKPGQWFLAAQDLTAWVGPWGVSFPANLTPDKETGTGTWTEDLFIKILRSGKHMGVAAGRPILPPMPWQNFAKMKDEDLKAIFAYLQTLPPISNKVPDPVPPAM